MAAVMAAQSSRRNPTCHFRKRAASAPAEGPHYDGAVFEMSSGTDNFTFLQNTFHGGAQIAQFYSQTKKGSISGDIMNFPSEPLQPRK